MTVNWLDHSGHRLLIGPSGLLVGRSSDCDIVLADPQVSRRHALLRSVDEGVELLSFGRTPSLVNGAAVGATALLQVGDVLACGGQTFTVAKADAAPSPPPAVLWGVERAAGMLFRISSKVFCVGGASTDHLIVSGWPETVFQLHQVGNGIVLEALHEGVCYGGEPLAVGESVHLPAGARVVYREHTLRVVALPSDPSKITEATLASDLPTGAELAFLPKGGRLTLRFGPRQLSVYLPDRRCDLVACLLQPFAPFARGDAIPEEDLIARIWPGQTQGRVDLNNLIFRTRKDLLKADIDGAALIERSAAGVRVRLAANAQVRVVSE